MSQEETRMYGEFAEEARRWAWTYLIIAIVCIAVAAEIAFGFPLTHFNVNPFLHILYMGIASFSSVLFGILSNSKFNEAREHLNTDNNFHRTGVNN